MKVFLCLIITFCLLSFINLSRAESKSKFPSYIKVCKRNSEAFKCVLENIERCKPNFTKGIPRLAIPPMAPFRIPELSIIGNNLEIKLRDVTVSNLENFEVVGGEINFDNFRFNLIIKIPYLYTEFHYEANGKLLVLNFNGKGTGNVNATGIDINISSKGHPVSKNGKTIIEIDDVNVDYKSKGGKVHLDNLFTNQDNLNDQTNKLINENFREFEDEISPDISKSVAELFKVVNKNLYEKFSFDELFPVE